MSDWRRVNKYELTGMRFGRLLVLRQGPYRGKRKTWVCLCDCGTEKVLLTHHLTRKGPSTVSCGCYAKEKAKNNHNSYPKHGHLSGGSTSPTYHSWSAMKCRCYQRSHAAYHRYGGRGITVCERWMDFENFLHDMGERPKGKTLDRIDNEKCYEPGNCKWSTPKQQSNNRCDNRIIEYAGNSLTVNQWSRITGVKPSTIRERLRRGWSIKRAISQEVVHV